MNWKILYFTFLIGAFSQIEAAPAPEGSFFGNALRAIGEAKFRLADTLDGVLNNGRNFGAGRNARSYSDYSNYGVAPTNGNVYNRPNFAPSMSYPGPMFSNNQPLMSDPGLSLPKNQPTNANIASQQSIDILIKCVQDLQKQLGDLQMQHSQKRESHFNFVDVDGIQHSLSQEEFDRIALEAAETILSKKEPPVVAKET